MRCVPTEWKVRNAEYIKTSRGRVSSAYHRQYEIHLSASQRRYTRRPTGLLEEAIIWSFHYPGIAHRSSTPSSQFPPRLELLVRAIKAIDRRPQSPEPP